MPTISAMAREAKKKNQLAPMKKSATRIGLPGIFKSSERVADSDLASDTESDSQSDSHSDVDMQLQKAATKPAIAVNGFNGNKRMAPAKPDSESDDDDESDSSDEESSGSGGSSSDEEKSEDEEDTVTEEATMGAVSPETSIDPAQAVPAPAEPVIPFTPPSGFEPLSSDRSSTSETSQVLGSQNLAGKEVWYITAPASVPISAIKKVSLEDVRLEKPSISLNGQAYGFVQYKTGDKGDVKVMILDGNSSTYRMARRSIDRTLHLQQIVQLPGLSNISIPQKVTNTQAQSRAMGPATNPVRQQPEGLRMRFLPIGSASTDHVIVSKTRNLSSDSEMKDARATFKKPLDFAQAEYEGDSSSSYGDTSSSAGESSNEDESMEDAEVSARAVAKSAEGSESTSEEDEDEDEDDGSSDSTSDDPAENFSAKPLSSIHLTASQPYSKKRKLSDIHNSNPVPSLSQSPYLNDRTLKKTKLNPPVSPNPPSELAKHERMNGNLKSALLPSNSTEAVKATKLTPIFPPKLPRNCSVESAVVQLKPPSIPVPPQRPIIPPPRINETPSITRTINRQGFTTSQSKPSAKSPEMTSRSARVLSSDNEFYMKVPSPSEEKSRGGLKPLKKSDNQDESIRRRRKEKTEKSVNDSTTNTPMASLHARSSSQTLQPSSAIKPHTKPSPARWSVQDAALNQNGNQMQSSTSQTGTKKPKQSSKEVPSMGNRLMSPALYSKSVVPPPRKASTILPPKLKASMSR